MKITALFVCALVSGLVLSSCKSSLKNFTPPHLVADHPNDAPGVAINRKQERDKREKTGRFKIGEELPVAGGKAMLFMSNPDYDVNKNPVGKMVEATSAKVIFCEGLYYFVETNNEDRGYIRETDLSSANADSSLPTPAAGGGSSAPTSYPSGGGIGAPSAYPAGDLPPLPAAGAGDIFPGDPLFGGDPGSTATTSSGRAVNIKTRETGRSKDFEKMKASLEKRSGAASATPSTPKPAMPKPASSDGIPDLPEPSASAGN